MKPLRSLRVLAVLALLVAFPVPAAAQDVAVDTILRRPLDDSAVPAGLGPTRQQGDFAPHLEDLLAEAAVAESATVRAPAVAPAPTSNRSERQPSIVLPILGGAVGGFVGLYGGGLTGYLAAGGDQGGSDFDNLGPALLGAFVGETVLLPIGVHVGSGSHGSFLGDLGISLLTGIAGVGMIGLLGAEGFGLGAAAQLAAVVANERATGRRHLAERAAAPAP